MKLLLGLLAAESTSLRLSKSYDIPDCRENYRGTANQSIYGEVCLRWDNLSTRVRILYFQFTKIKLTESMNLNSKNLFLE